MGAQDGLSGSAPPPLEPALLAPTSSIQDPPAHESVATPKQIDDDDVYVDITEGGVRGAELSKSGGRTTSYRSLHRTSSRQRLSRLESRIHPEHAKALLPTTALYISVMIALIGSFQTGWLLTQLNYLPFHSAKTCAAIPIAPDTCIMFPGHSKNEWTMTVTGWVVGAALGAVLSSIPADKFGRKKTMFLNAFIMIVGGAVQAIAQDPYVFALGRLFSGIATGTVINVSNVLISEISPCQMRGLFSTGLQVGVALGSLFVTTTHYIIGTGDIAWRFMVGCPIVFGAIQVVLMPLMVQSPVWLVGQGHVDDAALAMKKLYKPTNYEAILNALVSSHEEEQKEVADVKPWAAMVSKKYRLQLIIAILVCASHQITGVNAIMYYSATIFNNAGITDPRVANTIINVIRLISVVVVAKIMDKFKRKTMLITGMSVMAAASGGLVLSLVNSWSALAVTSVGVYIAAWGFSIGPMAWMVAAELFPDYLHANAGSVGTMFTWVSNFFVAVFYPVLASEDSLGNYAFLIFVGILVLLITFIAVVVPETSHKTYVEIASSFGIQEKPHEDDGGHDIWATPRVSHYSAFDEPNHDDKQPDTPPAPDKLAVTSTSGP
ncbi:hypothetical protein H257_06769 [Aphanomyces astaci]|uniref:Hexose transporter 1 n=1 Tax=Aphanomyces astaci TaxID=112090 RepID=W4GNP4_APHAT|nr:hypothetical protein H257_06769 [Aphanomyces astaci]ETV80503.1 hypothetical protein H257_06769 [Aphanomyces astaci]RQM29361.1 hypothetical protein B5M09_011861 [Aphanomyces astaci]|eukprot:XP_009830427.1 hypothetical protein H257_06769 [Aphanomyces astaci]